MMRLVRAGLARQDIAPPAAPRGAHVAQADKRAVLDGVLQAHGPRSILDIAAALPHVSPEPVLQALLLARDVPDLMDRWARMERFSHKRHRVLLEDIGERKLALRHVAQDDGPPPSRPETLLVMGVLVTLAEMVTGSDLRFGASDGRIWRQSGAWTDAAGQTQPGHYVLSGWSLARPEPRAPSLPPDLLGSLRAPLAEDPIRRWTLADLAATCARSPRSLQRDLAALGTTFSELVSEARLQAAAANLCKPNGPSLAETGFLAGFADQAHFTRVFSRHTGISPNIYRAEFRI
jgi:AraC-like DNA-binding protein